ncbi:putative secreted protein [Corynebacterium glutamicum ATCC 13032]|nr:hypothetical protein [Corynebacterium glutamicum]CAF20069.1 putative secreted protein [Corynebacterium glutamicum ATCC 13032]
MIKRLAAGAALTCVFVGIAAPSNAAEAAPSGFEPGTAIQVV